MWLLGLSKRPDYIQKMFDTLFVGMASKTGLISTSLEEKKTFIDLVVISFFQTEPRPK